MVSKGLHGCSVAEKATSNESRFKSSDPTCHLVPPIGGLLVIVGFQLGSHCIHWTTPLNRAAVFELFTRPGSERVLKRDARLNE